VFDQFVDWVSGSKWSYAAIFAVSMLDAFFPIVPSETAVITGGVLAGSGDLSLLFVILAASTGAFVGDNISYWLGAWLGERTVKKVFKGERSHKAFDWAEKQLEARGFYLIIIARFIPGGRTAVTFSSGYTHAMTYRRFVTADVIAAIIWGCYAALLGYVGGKQFEEEPWKGLLIAFFAAISVAGLVELIRSRREKRREKGRAGAAETAPADADAP
jgi:membrane protein DedA with SNARE-associated domain